MTADETAPVTFDVGCEPAFFDRIVFSSDRDGNRELYVMETDGSNAARVTSEPVPDELSAWTPAR